MSVQIVPPKYCPFCGNGIRTYFGDDKANCDNCATNFYVLEAEKMKINLENEVCAIDD